MPTNLSFQFRNVRFLRRIERGFRSGVLFASVILISGCASLQPRDFARSQTRFELDRYFTGHCRSWGVFENPHAQPRRYFTCDSYGKRDTAGDLTLTQHFRFGDGETQMRVWHIHQMDTTHWEATANDMIGVARGEGLGNAFYLEYTITLDRNNPMATVHIRQWMYQPEGTDNLMTRLVITKLGFTVAEVSEVIHHVQATHGISLSPWYRPAGISDKSIRFDGALPAFE